MLYNLFTNILNGLRAFAGDAVNYLKCRSMCCNKFHIYHPKSCCFQGDIQNRWTRASTPGSESPIKKDSTKFFTPRNNNSK